MLRRDQQWVLALVGTSRLADPHSPRVHSSTSLAGCGATKRRQMLQGPQGPNVATTGAKCCNCAQCQAWHGPNLPHTVLSNSLMLCSAGTTCAPLCPRAWLSCCNLLATNSQSCPLAKSTCSHHPHMAPLSVVCARGFTLTSACTQRHSSRLLNKITTAAASQRRSFNKPERSMEGCTGQPPGRGRPQSSSCA